MVTRPKTEFTGDAARSAMPARAGVGLKPEHYRDILENRPQIGFFEVHAENYMGAGGLPHRMLGLVAERYPLSIHGVGLSIGGTSRLDADHLERLRRLNERYRPALFSEHLAWSSHGSNFYNDLLPVPYNGQTLHRVVDHVDELQEALGRAVLLENPSTYVAFAASTWSELDFIAEVAGRTGCALLLDVNNVYVSAINHGFRPEAYLDAFPVGTVAEIHLAGHARDHDAAGRPLLIDAHDRAVADTVWTLYRRALARTGPVPTLIEWDNDVPSWPVLASEADRAETILDEIRPAARTAAEEARDAVPA